MQRSLNRPKSPHTLPKPSQKTFANPPRTFPKPLQNPQRKCMFVNKILFFGNPSRMSKNFSKLPRGLPKRSQNRQKMMINQCEKIISKMHAFIDFSRCSTSKSVVFWLDFGNLLAAKPKKTRSCKN